MSKSQLHFHITNTAQWIAQVFNPGAELGVPHNTHQLITHQLEELELPVTGDPMQDLAEWLRHEFSQGHSQSAVAAALINLTRGCISPESLTVALRYITQKPNLSERHGPHFLCLARKGKLKKVDLRYDVPTKRMRTHTVSREFSPEVTPTLSQTRLLA